jgi:hypothetical protein
VSGFVVAYSKKVNLIIYGIMIGRRILTSPLPIMGVLFLMELLLLFSTSSKIENAKRKKSLIKEHLQKNLPT